jgi:hypothetical protein
VEWAQQAPITGVIKSKVKLVNKFHLVQYKNNRVRGRRANESLALVDCPVLRHFLGNN